MKQAWRWLFSALAALSLAMLLITAFLWSVQSHHRINFGLFGHPIEVWIGPRTYGVVVRIYATGTVMMPWHYVGPSVTGVDTGSSSQLHFGMCWGAGYQISNLTANSPNPAAAQTWRQLQLSFLYPFTLLALAAGLFGYLSIKMRRAAPLGHCVRCGYDLRATPGRCPECGKIVEKTI